MSGAHPLATLRDAWAALDARRAAAIAFLVTLAVGFATMTPDLIGVFFDDAIYALVGKAIAAGQGYVYPQLPGTPPAIHYPPVWPALLAVVWKFGPTFPDNIGLLKALNPCILATAAAGGTLVLRRLFGLSAGAAMCTMLAATVSIPMQVLTNVLLSEPLFIALLFPALYTAERLRADGGLRMAVLAGACAGLLVLTRTIAGAYVAATVLVLLAERRWRDAALYAVVVAALLAPWQYFVWKHSPTFPDELRGSYGPYLEWVVNGYRDGGVPFLRQVVAKNATDTWRFTGAVLTPGFPGGILRPAATVLAFFVTLVGGVVAWGRPRTRILALGTLGYAAAVVVWPYQVERFLWAIWPLLLVLALDGARWVAQALRRAARPRTALVATGLAAALVAGYAFYNLRGLRRGWASTAAHAASERLVEMVRYVNADPRVRRGVIATEADPVIALYTGATTVPVEILEVRDHVRQKTPRERAAILEAVDRRFHPDAYVVMLGSPFIHGLVLARLEPTRRFHEITPPGFKVRSFIRNTQ